MGTMTQRRKQGLWSNFKVLAEDRIMNTEGGASSVCPNQASPQRREVWSSPQIHIQEKYVYIMFEGKARVLESWRKGE